MKAQAGKTGKGAAGQKMRTIREGKKKTLGKERVSQLAPVRKSGAYRGNAGRPKNK